MKVPHLEPKQRKVALLGAAAVLVLLVVAFVALRGDDGDTTTAADPASTTAADGSTATDGSTEPGGTTKDPGAAANSDRSTTTTTPSGATTAPGQPGSDDPGSDDPAAGDPGGTPGGNPGGTPGGTPRAGDPAGGGGQPTPAADPVGGGEGANVGVVDPDDAQSPPLRLPGTRSEPCAGTGPPTIPLPQRDGPSGDGGRWDTVGSLAGNCGAKGKAFTTAGVDTRLVFRSDAEQMIVFVDDRNDSDAAAGYADVECRVRCAGTRILVNRGGSFNLRVQATDGPWQVELQEYRR